MNNPFKDKKSKNGSTVYSAKVPGGYEACKIEKDGVVSYKFIDKSSQTDPESGEYSGVAHIDMNGNIRATYSFEDPSTGLVGSVKGSVAISKDKQEKINKEIRDAIGKGVELGKRIIANRNKTFDASKMIGQAGR